MCGTALKCHLCFSAAAPKVSQSQAQSDVAISKPFPVMGGHPVPESGLMQSQGLVHISVELPSFDVASVSSCRCHPSSGFGHYHHRSAAAHDRLSSQTCSSQAQESPPPHNRGVWLPHQWHVPVANQAGGWSERLGHWCGRQELDARLFLHSLSVFPSVCCLQFCPHFRLETLWLFVNTATLKPANWLLCCW